MVAARLNDGAALVSRATPSAGCTHLGAHPRAPSRSVPQQRYPTEASSADAGSASLLHARRRGTQRRPSNGGVLLAPSGGRATAPTGEPQLPGKGSGLVDAVPIPRQVADVRARRCPAPGAPWDPRATGSPRATPLACSSAPPRARALGCRSRSTREGVPRAVRPASTVPLLHVKRPPQWPRRSGAALRSGRDVPGVAQRSRTLLRSARRQLPTRGHLALATTRARTPPARRRRPGRARRLTCSAPSSRAAAPPIRVATRLERRRPANRPVLSDGGAVARETTRRDARRAGSSSAPTRCVGLWRGAPHGRAW